LIHIILNTFVFFFITIFYFYSLTGYGKLLAKNNFSIDKNYNFFELQFFGLIIKIVIGFILYITIGTNLIINFIILLIGFFLYFFYKKELNQIKLSYILILTLSIFTVLIISKTHEDFNSYHYFSIHEIFNNGLRLGVTKLKIEFFHSSLLTYEQSLLILPYFNFKLVNLPIFLIYLSVLGYFFNILLLHNKKKEIFYSIISIIILLVKFNRLGAYGYDYIAQFLLLIVFHKIYFYSSNEKELFKSILFFLLSILIKPVSLLFSPIFLYLIYKNRLNFNLKLIFSNIIIIISLLFILFSSSFLKSGCVFYPLNSSCLSTEKVFWSEKDRMEEYSESIKLWSQGYYVNKSLAHKTKDERYTKIDNKIAYQENFNWVRIWFEHHFFYKVFEFLMISIFTLITVHIYFKRDNFEESNNFTDKIAFNLLLFLSVIFWFLAIPQFRFGFSILFIFLFLLFDIFLNLKITFNKKKFTYLILFCLIILNVKNINRINSEFKRNDFYKFTNFPFYNEIKIKNDYSNLTKSKFFFIELLK